MATADELRDAGRSPTAINESERANFRHAHRFLPSDVRSGIERPPRARRMEVIEVWFRRGEGCCEEDVAREVVAYYDLDGKLLAERDPFGVGGASSPVDWGDGRIETWLLPPEVR